MTQYYEPEARRFERLANEAEDGTVLQAWYRKEAARIGTPVRHCPDGFELPSLWATKCRDCVVRCDE